MLISNIAIKKSSLRRSASRLLLLSNYTIYINVHRVILLHIYLSLSFEAGYHCATEPSGIALFY